MPEEKIERSEILTLSADIVAALTKRMAAGGLVVMLVADRAVFGVFRRRYGLFFALGCVPLQLLFYLYSTVAFVGTTVFAKKAEKDA